MARVVDASGNLPANVSGPDPDCGSAEDMVNARDARIVTTSDTVDIPTGSHRLYIGGAGNVNLITKQGNTVLFSAVPVGTFLDVAAKRIMATNTTATLIIALY